ncbi:MAG: hypothetical protein K2X11_02695 [Acetobacteraceae bacterium]|nr:hypothetical protein [Acetobacteraceae bacterium]
MTDRLTLLLIATILPAVPAAAQQTFPCAGRLVPVSTGTQVATAGSPGGVPGTRYFYVWLRNQGNTNLVFDMVHSGFPADVQTHPPLTPGLKRLTPGQSQGYLVASTMNASFSPLTIAYVPDDAGSSGRPTVRLQNCRTF